MGEAQVLEELSRQIYIKEFPSLKRATTLGKKHGYDHLHALPYIGANNNVSGGLNALILSLYYYSYIR